MHIPRGWLCYPCWQHIPVGSFVLSTPRARGPMQMVMMFQIDKVFCNLWQWWCVKRCIKRFQVWRMKRNVILSPKHGRYGQRPLYESNVWGFGVKDLKARMIVVGGWQFRITFDVWKEGKFYLLFPSLMWISTFLIWFQLIACVRFFYNIWNLFLIWFWSLN